MIHGYARVSTKGQARDGNSLEAQKLILTEAGAVKIFTDTFTGTKIDRPEFEKLQGILAPGDIIIVTKLGSFSQKCKSIRTYHRPDR